ncbi:MAG: molybdopterin-dependent oxidoreductase [Methanoregulaceae archaeon]|jgi:DMSO/TMAO reductase YedYZ molybdopterin-dependent catalytic subunit
MNTRAAILAIALVIIVAIILIFVVFKVPVTRTGSEAGGPTPLAQVEVRSYQGKDLSSVNDFHENSIKGPQHINISDYQLIVTGLTNRTLVYSYDQILAKFPHYSKVVTLFCVEGWDATILWEGVLVRDIIADAGADPRANTVILTAHDGYTTSFPLTYFTQRDIIMAYRMNNITLPAERGYPFELVAEDKWGYKWIKWVEKIELSDNPTYRGYWEQRGYSNTGDLNKSFSQD